MEKTYGRWGRETIEKARQRFLSKIEKNDSGCWMWTAAKNRRGYGIVGFMGQSTLAHRVSASLFKNADIRGWVVMHTCDVPGCVNPDHLLISTQAENIADMEQKRRGKHPSGHLHGRAKLTAEQVREIREKHLTGRSINSLAREYGVSSPSVSRIVKYEGWTKPDYHIIPAGPNFPA